MDEINKQHKCMSKLVYFIMVYINTFVHSQSTGIYWNVKNSMGQQFRQIDLGETKDRILL